MAQRSIYIHIPFCKTHCPYCDFAIFLDHKNEYIESYINALMKEIKTKLEPGNIQTIYFGGGTPSLIDPQYINRILNTIKEIVEIPPGTEITLETNPGTVTLDKLTQYKEIGINRLSIGTQTFTPHILMRLARGHNVEDVYQTIEWAQKAGFHNISIDLIYGLPKQSLKDWEYDISKAIELDIPHISCYSLTIEENTPYHNIYGSNNHTDLADDEEMTEYYHYICQALNKNGFEHYEVSNYAKPQYRSQHNQIYWQMKEYYGFGVGAHGYINNQRYSRTKDLKKYIKNPIQTIPQDTNIRLETLMLSLRTKEGLNLNKYKDKFNIDILKKNQQLINNLVENELATVSNNTLQLTEAGLFISNEIISRFRI